MRHFLIIAGFLIGSMPVMASSLHEDIAIQVNGMVCDFCAQSVWNIFEKYETVQSVDIDLDSGTVTVHMQPGQTLDDAALDKAITYAGYDLVSVKRIQADHG